MMRWCLPIVAVLLLPALARADGDAALMKACPGLADWADTHPHGEAVTLQADAGYPFTDPALRQERPAHIDQVTISGLHLRHA